MRVVRLLLTAIVSTTLLAGCASNERFSMAIKRTADPAVDAAPALAYQSREDDQRFPLFKSFEPVVASPLAGRTIAVSRYSDIALKPKEVVLTFDDGPMPGKTNKILKTLGDYGISATFFMVGEMAKAYPKIARDVAEAGHTIGTHTFRHANLRMMSDEAAMAEIRKGQISVAEALAPIGVTPAPFFRFPYLASTTSIRHHLANEGIVAIDVDIDSKDYFHGTPEMVRTRVLHALDVHNHGIILFHDIQARTATMLPSFLAALQSRGFKVVRLVPANEAPLVASR
ncbi:polysaccharide deacetylase family protein [Jiella sp. MQZ9-1]|uniref:Chitooligosaccharide deacetylase n=1 Tax=Jiella flava TaxID=2816857 RepID=A0A939FXE2_9HYPH|nr:polysaccharide deacetylase family protein [Jiella flava]MBO0663270.1 polysaccharide deacetylase family protein [Jiella flava]MCD2471846.1 polysaccharide deacetylase family protein [Jiella flava]